MSSSARAATSGEDGHDAISASHPAVTVTASASVAPASASPEAVGQANTSLAPESPR